MPRFLLLLAFLLTVGCQADKPENSPLLPNESSSNGLPNQPAPEDLDEIFREGAGLLQGDITIRGTSETNPDWDDHPFPISQAARAGDLAVFRVRGRLSNNATTTLFCKLSQTTKNYPSYFIPGTNTDTYRAIYVENNEPMNLTFYNSSNYNTAQNSKAAIYNYSFKTSAVENADEPNDDDNGATTSDRTLAKNIPRDFMATRSVYYFDQTKRDIEEWYRTEVPAGVRFSWKFATTPGRYGSSWSYQLRVFDPGGVQMGETVDVGPNEGAQGVSRTATTTGTHYLQIVATPISKSYTNLFYALYTVTPCFAPQINSIVADAEANFCPGGSVTFAASVTYGASSYNWTFGNGAVPAFSTAAQPTITVGNAATIPIQLVVGNGCNTTTYNMEYSGSCNGGAGQQGGLGVTTMVSSDLKGFPDGYLAQIGYFSGAIDLDPGPGTGPASTQGVASYLALISADGSLDSFTIIGGATGTSVTARAVDYHALGGYRILGNYSGTVDFDSGPGVTTRTSSTDGGNFVLALSPSGTFQWVATYGAGVTGGALGFLENGTSVAVGGAFQGTVDMDPGLGVLTKTASGIDAYLMVLSGDGYLQDLDVWGGAGNEDVQDLSARIDAIDIVGTFSGTTDFDPGPGTANLTSTGSFAGYYSRFGVWAPTNAQFSRAKALTGGTSTVRPLAVAIVPTGSQLGAVRIAGNFTGSPDFDPGAGSQTITSNGLTDGFLLGLDAASNFSWVHRIGGSGNDSMQDLTLNSAATALRVAGTWQTTVDFNPGAGVDSRTVAGGNDAFLLAFQVDGTWEWSSTWGGSDFENAQKVTLDDFGRARVTGPFSGTSDLKPGPGVLNLTAQGENDIFLNRILANGLWE